MSDSQVIWAIFSDEEKKKTEKNPQKIQSQKTAASAPDQKR